jgi:hypothetical protein
VFFIGFSFSAPIKNWGYCLGSIKYNQKSITEWFKISYFSGICTRTKNHESYLVVRGGYGHLSGRLIDKHTPALVVLGAL